MLVLLTKADDDLLQNQDNFDSRPAALDLPLTTELGKKDFFIFHFSELFLFLLFTYRSSVSRALDWLSCL